MKVLVVEVAVHGISPGQVVRVIAADGRDPAFQRGRMPAGQLEGLSQQFLVHVLGRGPGQQFLHHGQPTAGVGRELGGRGRVAVGP
ncbi:MAG TPA: hypothetical protein VGG50_12125 [Streptosporangiaceae bacterium]|jgi:hypothetical protein